MQMLQSIAMGRFSTLALAVLLLLVISAPAIDGHPTGKFNTSDGCSCHSTSAINAQLSGYPSTYEAGEQYVLAIGMSISAPAGGFSLDIDKGTLSNPSTDAQVDSLQLSATHSSSDSTSWTVTWTAPSSGSGMVTFSLAVLAADGNIDTEGDSSGVFSVQIAEVSPNVAPQVSLSLPQSADSSTDLVANISSSDADDDPVTISIQWLRNGFREGSLDNLQTVPAIMLGPGQVWTCKVIGNDGIENSQEAIASTTISNSPPTALISIVTNPVWIGEVITVTSQMSSDSDGEVVNSIWSWLDSSGNSGSAHSMQSFTFTAYSQVTLTLQVVDDLGGIGLATKTIEVVNGPHVSNIASIQNGQQVELSWQWDGPQSQFSVIRNGNVIATTNQTSFTDTPIFSGETSYSIQPIVDGRHLDAGSESSPIIVESSFKEIQSTNDFAGMILGFIMLILSLIAVAMGYLNRGE
jgi:hypothetical protein